MGDMTFAESVKHSRRIFEHHRITTQQTPNSATVELFVVARGAGAPCGAGIVRRTAGVQAGTVDGASARCGQAVDGA